MPRTATIKELQDWRLNGATWRTFDLRERFAVVELLTCHGELVDVVETDDPEVIEFVRSHQTEV